MTQDDVQVDQVQVSGDGGTVWVHALDGSTVGRFSKRFGIDLHSTFLAQLAGASQCLHCTHEPAGAKEWEPFCSLVARHFGIAVPIDTIQFSDQAQPWPGLNITVEQAADRRLTHITRLPNGIWCALQRFNFTWGVLVGLDAFHYQRRYCYPSQVEAAHGLQGWDGAGHPPGPWVKVKGDGIDMLNPALTA